jgi:hypothetical protein
MGYANIYHIAPAVLHMNPGVTRDEYLHLLNQTHGSSYPFHFETEPEKIPLTFFNEKEDDFYFHSLEGLASLLELGRSKEYEEFQKTKFDEDGIPIETPYWYPRISGKGTFTLFFNEKNETKEIIENVITKQTSTIKINDVLNFNDNEFPNVLVKKINKKTFNGLITEYGDFDHKKVPLYKYDLYVLPFRKIQRKIIYNSKEELFNAWPIFSPDKEFNWAKEKGSFKGLFNSLRDYQWIKKDNKYYLDEITFDKISASEYRMLILTEEAIKDKVWKVFSYKGDIWFGQYLKEYPLARKVFEKACIDSHYSIYAKQNNMSHSDLFRMRALNDVRIK